MQILSKLTTAAVLAGGVAAQGPSVYISPGSASFVPGTFGTTSDDGSYISAGVANNGNYDDVSFTSQNGGFPANVGYNNYGGYPGAGFQGGYQGGFQGGYQPGFQPGFQPNYPQPQQGLSPPPPPIYQAGTGVSGGNLPQGQGQGLTPPPPPVYQAGTGVSGGNLPSNGPPPLVQVGQATHTGGFKKHQKRDVKQYPYGYSAYNPYAGPTVTIGQPPAYFVPGTFGTTFSDGGYTSWGTPVTGYKQRLNKRQTISATAGPYGPTVSVGAPSAYFVPGTFGTTFADGGYTSWGVAQPQYPYGASSYYPTPYHSKREVSSTLSTVDGAIRADRERSENGSRAPRGHAYGSQDYNTFAKPPRGEALTHHDIAPMPQSSTHPR